MPREYKVLRLPGFRGEWDAVPALSIDCRSWEAGGPVPPAQAQIAFDGGAFHVRMRAWEHPLAVKTRRYNGGIWEDSCIEFFFNPTGGRDSRYLNFEINAEGFMLLGCGSGRHDTRSMEFDPKRFHIRTDVPVGGAAEWAGPYFTIDLTIPVDFLEEIYGKLDLQPGAVMGANFQKCGEKTGNPHYGCWNPIASERPDFHRPECFGKLVLG